MVIGVLVVHQSALQFSRAGKSGLFDHLAYTPVKALHHPIGLWVPGWHQSVFNALGFALQIKRMLTAGLFFFAGKSVCKLACVVSQ